MILNSDLFESTSEMAPNSEGRNRVGDFQFLEENNKEKQRPPIYNPEDYALMLKKWGKKSVNGGMVSLYSTSSTTELECSRSQNNSFRDYRNPMLISAGSEMTLRQFGTVSELLSKLKADLRLAFPSFVQEFVSDPLDGVTLLLDLLRAIQLSQSNASHIQAGSSNTTGKIPPSLQRKALLDELSCLQCLSSCCSRYSEAIRKLTASSAGLFTLAICIMSNVNKSRIIALQLLAKACETSIGGHSEVSEAMSTLRLRFGEPVRFRFLVGMLMSAGGQKELTSSGLRFINKFLESSGSTQKRVYIQAELEQAGLDIATIKKNMGHNINEEDQILEELKNWEKSHIDVESTMLRLEKMEKENDNLRDKVLLLERKVQILQEEKGVLVSLEQCLKDRCSELQGEVRSLKSEKSPIYTKRKDEKSPNEDEGISSSERSLTPDECQSVYKVFTQNPAIQNADTKTEEEDEEETTIDEVIEELRNIINDAESEDYAKREMEERKKTEEAQVAAKLQIMEESEIIPMNLHPQPPRRTRSLVHLFVPSEDYYYCNKELFFENETAFTSEEGSDSLLSASKCHLPRVEKDTSTNIYEKKPSRRHSSKASMKRSESFLHMAKNSKKKHPSFDGSYYYGSPIAGHQQEKNRVIEELATHRIKCKSLERIDGGLDSMIDIVVTSNIEKNNQRTVTSLSRSISSAFLSPKKETKSKLSTHSEEKQRMFLPTHRDTGEVPYYFPRLQEKRSNSSSFLVRRGHGNAGMYSGQVVPDHGLVKSKEFVSSSSNVKLSGKVTDMPSGLY